MKIFYVDDSGNESLTTFTAIAVPAHRWSASLGAWLAWRRHLLEEHDVDVRRRLHATDWVAGRGRPSSDERAGLNRNKPLRWREYVHALNAISRRVEDLWKRDARDSQWPQIADFAAYAAFQHIAKVPERAFMWRWYEDCLGRRIVRDEYGVDGVRGLEPSIVS